MDTGRLLKTIEDIQIDEKNFGFQAKFQNILNHYTQNIPDALNQEKEAIKTGLEQSLLSNYVLSDFKILNQLGIRNFFGEDSYLQLEAMLSSQAHEVSKKLTDFIKNRQDAITKLSQTKSALNSFELKPRELLDKQYEVGFSFPTEYQNVSQLKNVLEDINQLLSEIAAEIGETADFKISYVNNGSIEIYVQATQALAQNVDVLIDYALKIYGFIEMTRNVKKGFSKFAKKRKEDMEKEVEAEKKEKTENLLQEMVKELNIKSPEIQSRVTNLFKKFLKHLERGVSAEVRTPQIPTPTEPTDGADKAEKSRLKILKEEFEVKNKIDQRNKEIFKLQSKNFDGLDTKFLSNGEEDRDIAQS